MEIVLENIKMNDWEFTTTLSGNDIIGITGPEYEEILDILNLKALPQGEIKIDDNIINKDNYLDYYKLLCQ